jgi:carboxyl-terminal processing protease
MVKKINGLYAEDPNMKGLVPDLLVEEYADGDGLNGLRLREADLQKHLSNDRDKEAETQAKVDELEQEQRLAALEKKRKPLEFGGKEDFQLVQALNHLKGLPVQLSQKAKVESKKEATINDKDEHKDEPKNGGKK